MALFEQLIKIYEDSNGFFNSIDFFYGKKINRWINELDQNSGFDTQLSAVFVVVAMAMLIWFGQAGLWAWLSIPLLFVNMCLMKNDDVSALECWRPIQWGWVRAEPIFLDWVGSQTLFWLEPGLRSNEFCLDPIKVQKNSCPICPPKNSGHVKGRVWTQLSPTK